MKALIHLSLWTALACGIATANEVTDWNQTMLLATLTAPPLLLRSHHASRRLCRRASSTR